MKVLFVVNENHVDIFSSFIKTKETFGDEVKVISKTEEFNQDGWEVIRDDDSKEDALILDLAGNYNRHGLPSDPRVRKKREKKSKGEGVSGPSVCPNCFEVTKEEICPACGEELIKKVDINDVEMKDVEQFEVSYYIKKMWYKLNYTTKRGFKGTLFCVSLDGYEKALFKFCSSGSINEQVELSRSHSHYLQNNDIFYGEKYKIVETGYGKWIDYSRDSQYKINRRKQVMEMNKKGYRYISESNMRGMKVVEK